MNTKSAWQILCSLVLCLGISGCEKSSLMPASTPPRDSCADYGALTALLAEATVSCTETIGPKSFVIKDGYLRNTFTSCVPAANKGCGPKDQRECPLERVNRLLGLQEFPRFRGCLTDHYTRWSKVFQDTHLATCPKWGTPTVIAQGSLASSKQLSKMQPQLPYYGVTQDGKEPGTAVYITPVTKTYAPPGFKPSDADRLYAGIEAPSKSSILYNIAYEEADSTCDDPAVCAAQCAAFLPGFVVSAAGNQLLADPASWFRDDIFSSPLCSSATKNNPYCLPYVHQMSTTRTSPTSTAPPGDIYGYGNRGNNGERCLRWVPGTAGADGGNYQTDLVLECTDSAQTHCLSRCGN
ncbi:MAG TPA: hypothetical protein VGC79_18995 [Polyangiaceae bacterium]